MQFLKNVLTLDIHFFYYQKIKRNLFSLENKGYLKKETDKVGMKILKDQGCNKDLPC